MTHWPIDQLMKRKENNLPIAQSADRKQNKRQMHNRTIYRSRLINQLPDLLIKIQKQNQNQGKKSKKSPPIGLSMFRM